MRLKLFSETQTINDPEVYKFFVDPLVSDREWMVLGGIWVITEDSPMAKNVGQYGNLSIFVGRHLEYAFDISSFGRDLPYLIPLLGSVVLQNQHFHVEISKACYGKVTVQLVAFVNEIG